MEKGGEGGSQVVGEKCQPELCAEFRAPAVEVDGDLGVQMIWKGGSCFFFGREMFCGMPILVMFCGVFRGVLS
jgi:hypothetical protein